MRRTTVAIGTAAGLLIAIQLFPVNRSNPAVEEPLPLPAAVAEIVRISCYDCHSHETTWPWYSYVAPVSWLVARDVHEGREHLNLSTWNRYDAEERAENLEEMWEEIDEGEMPPWYYAALHSEARLTDAERSALRSWLMMNRPGGDRDADDAGEVEGD